MNVDVLKALFYNTIQKEYRSKTLIFLLTLSFLLMFVLHMNSSNLDFVGGAFKIKIIYTIVDIWSFILAVILGVDCVRSDRTNNVLLQVLALPIYRWQYLISRITGTWLIVVLYYIASVLSAYIMFSEGPGGIGEILGGAFIINALIILTIIVFSIIYSFFLPKIFSIFCTFITYSLTSLSGYYFPKDFLWEEVFSNLGIMKIIGIVFYIFVPHLSSLNTLSNQLISGTDPTFNVPWELTHFICSFTVLFFLAIWILKKRA